jgi:hypothetical protein
MTTFILFSPYSYLFKKFLNDDKKSSPPFTSRAILEVGRYYSRLRVYRLIPRLVSESISLLSALARKGGKREGKKMKRFEDPRP